MEERKGKVGLLRKYFSGDLTRRECGRYILWTLPIYLFLLFTSLALYPPELKFGIMTHTMSYLGNFLLNPEGWLWFSFSVWWLAISILPLLRTLKRHMTVINDWAKRFSGFLFELSWITMFIIGCLPDIQIDHWLTFYHILIAEISLGSYAVAGFLFWMRGRKVYPQKTVFTFGYMYYIGLFIMLITQIYVKATQTPYPAPGLLSFPMWEWYLFFAYLAFFYALVLELPTLPDVKKAINKEIAIEVETKTQAKKS